MKDLGAAKKIQCMKINRDGNSIFPFLSQHSYINKFFILLICLMQRNPPHLLHHTSNCSLFNVMFLMKILSTCHEFHTLVLPGLS
jgi:hypothetical protein